jgi:hypothetical protein
MKTVGTFDLCMEVTAAACGFNQQNTNNQIAIEKSNDTSLDDKSVVTSKKDFYDTNKTAVLRAAASESSEKEFNEVEIEQASKFESEEESESAHEQEQQQEDEFDYEHEIFSTTTTSISPKRQRHISSSDNSITVDDNLLSSMNSKKKFRSLSSNSYLANSCRTSGDYRCKSAELLDNKDKTFDEILACAASARDFRNKSEENIYENFRRTSIGDELDMIDSGKTSDDDFNNQNDKPFKSIPLNLRRRTLKKSKKIIRTDSELFKDQILNSANTSIRKESSVQASKNNSIDSSGTRDMSTDTVFSDMCEEQQIDLERLENEYKEHVRSSLQREYKSDGDSLDEIGKHYHGSEWKNQSIDLNFLEDNNGIPNKNNNNSNNHNNNNNNTNSSTNRSSSSSIVVNDERNRKHSVARKADSVNECKPARKDSGKRTKSEGDKDSIYVDKHDSIETQSTEDDNNNTSGSGSNKNNNGSEPHVSKEVKPMSLFERRFGKFRKMNKLLKVKRFSTSALYDNVTKRKSDASTSKPSGKGDQNQSAPLSLFQQVSELASSKASLSSPKSLKGKKFMLKKRKFSFFGKSQSNNDLNINLKSIASKLSLLSKSNFDLSTRNSSNLRLNAMGIYGKYGTSNEYRSDILTAHQHGCTSPLTEAFYNATGSYQLTAMELFEKFCSQDFTGLYKHEPLNEEDEKIDDIDAGHAYKGAIKKSSSLRKATLLKQNSEPKFNVKNYTSDYYNPPDAFEEEELDAIENEYDYDVRHSAARRRSSYTRQHQVEFDQNDQYFEDNEGHYYVPEEDPAEIDDLEEIADVDEDEIDDLEAEIYRNSSVIVDGDIDEIYLMPEKEHRYDSIFLRNSDEILAIDETDEELLDEALKEDHLESESAVEHKNQLLSLYEICPKDNDDFNDEGGCDDMEETSASNSNINKNRDDNLKTIISEYVKNTCSSMSAASDSHFSRSKSMDLLSNSSETLKTNSNSEYAFDTVKQINLDSCSTSKLSLSLNSDIFDDITISVSHPPPFMPDTTIKTLKISEIDDFTLTPDGSITENSAAATGVNNNNIVNDNNTVPLSQMSEQEKIKNELHSQYTIIDCDELEHDDEDEDMRRFNDEKSSFAEALNKEFDKLFSRAKNDSDTDLTITPSVATTVLTAIKLPSRCSMEKLEPFEIDSDTLIGGINEESDKNTTSINLLSQSMTSTALHQSLLARKDNETMGLKDKSKRSHSLGAINKKKSNKCTPL